MLAGDGSPAGRATVADPLVIDLDATLVTAHSEKEKAAATFKRGFGFHPLCAFVDHGPQGTGEPLTILLRAGNAGSNTAADHQTVIADALDQAGLGSRPGRRGRTPARNSASPMWMGTGSPRSPPTPAAALADLELRHRRRARCEDRIRLAKDTGLTNLRLYPEFQVG